MKRIALVVTLTIFGIACGGGGSGGGSGASNTSPSDLLIGNFHFAYAVGGSDYVNRYSIDQISNNTTSEGTPIYQGYDADLPSLQVAAAWYPSDSAYVALAQTVLSGVYEMFSYVIESDGRLTGCYRMVIDGMLSDCYALNSAESKRFAKGSWSRTKQPYQLSIMALSINSRVSMIKSSEPNQADGEFRALINSLRNSFD